MADEIIKELWQIKDAIAHEFHCDIKALVDYVRSKKHDEEREVVDLRSIRQATQRAQPDSNHIDLR